MTSDKMRKGNIDNEKERKKEWMNEWMNGLRKRKQVDTNLEERTDTKQMRNKNSRKEEEKGKNACVERKPG